MSRSRLAAATRHPQAGSDRAQGFLEATITSGDQAEAAQ
jgi:hypothetical protein